ncbi:hypothetical protein CECT5772_08843 [Streptococcus equi subsp. ruminatorum CECT 5772]|uniref:Uncharacterized protein n=1 Tax=Streptococcus equi subsp. ruminatorum CECT 5772 TaxID=1051981 RepID=A0A922SYZ9_9STRE|nr:hypothetical protein CECT5772_08843 [Streptococcus equi subsp. ruminatorum CECT 5772]
MGLLVGAFSKGQAQVFVACLTSIHQQDQMKQ